MVAANLNVFRPPFPDGVDRPFGAV